MKVLNNNSRILDSQENEKMIKNGKIADLTNPSNYQINKYVIESVSTGCKYELTHCIKTSSRAFKE